MRSEGGKDPGWIAGAERSAHPLPRRGAQSGPGCAGSPLRRPGTRSGIPRPCRPGAAVTAPAAPRAVGAPAFSPALGKNAYVPICASFSACFCVHVYLYAYICVCVYTCSPRVYLGCVRVSLVMKGVAQLSFMVVNGLPGEVPAA